MPRTELPLHLDPHPIPDSYWVDPGRLLAGEYPGAKAPGDARLKLRRFLAAGITYFVDLTEAHELAPYDWILQQEAAAQGLAVEHWRAPIPDLGTPTSATVTRILDAVDDAMASGHRVYVHCWGGIGRTGTIVGCYLVRHGMTGEQALREIVRLREGTPDGDTPSPETRDQCERVRTWTESCRRPKGDLRDRLRGVAVGAAIGDALGMPLEFGPAIPVGRLVRVMRPGRLPAGAFTDDTEMALALADSLLESSPLDPENLAAHFVAWYECRPPDVGNNTRAVLSRISRGEDWRTAAEGVARAASGSAGNGSVMRCWPVALAHWDHPELLLADSRLQSQVTHTNPNCVAGSAFVNMAIYHLLHGMAARAAVARALDDAAVPQALRQAIEAAPGKPREQLPNSGWVLHTLESAVWGLLTTESFEEAVVQVVNLGDDADTAGAVVGALAGAAYGLAAIPEGWREALTGEWPLRSGRRWDAARLAALADRLAGERAG